MAGYYGFSKSSNAIEAEDNGRFSASQLARRLGVKAGAIKAILSPSEWHHTSKHFNPTDYYSEEDALEILDRLRARREPKKTIQVFENCSGHYLEWSGTRKHPRADEITFTGIRVSKKGKWFTLELPRGPVRKGEHTRGFHLRDSQGKHLAFNP